MKMWIVSFLLCILHMINVFYCGTHGMYTAMSFNLVAGLMWMIDTLIFYKD